MPVHPPDPEPAPHEGTPPRASLGARMVTLGAVVVPLLGLVAAVVLLWGWGFRWVDLGLLAGAYVLTAFGITVGFHRLFTHRSFETNPVVKFVLAACGSMAVQAPLFNWVAHHRIHHHHSDTPDDPHTPHHKGAGVLGWLRGFWHAHVGWAFTPDAAGLSRYVKDLRKSPSLRVASALFPLWVVLGLLIPAALGGLVSGSWAGALLGLIWGGLVRILLVHHVTWSVNSVCHLWGLRPYDSGDESRDNVVFGVLAMGEGWHNAHHAFPTSARHGLSWWKIDASYYVIRALALVGLAWDVKEPTQEALANKRRGHATNRTPESG
jgi:stearoyl-CoA desaturase (Delta-9 desaturase)